MFKKQPNILLFLMMLLVLPRLAAAQQDQPVARSCALSGVMRLFERPCLSPAKTDMASVPELPVQPALSLHPFRATGTASPYARPVLAEVSSKSESGAHALLGARCENNRTSVAFRIPDGELSDVRQFGEIVYSLDGNETMIVETDLSPSNHKVMGVWEGYRAVPFLKELAGAQSMTIDVLSKGGKSLIYDFDLAEFNRDLNTVRAACNW